MMKVLFVINPHSGSGDQDILNDLISEQVKNLKLNHRIYRMKSGNQEKAIRKEIEIFNPGVVACAGGDGTVNMMATIMAGSKAGLLIIPLGSANGMAKELGINNIEDAVLLLSKAENRQIDLLNINGNICIHLADVGVNARVVKRFQEDPRRGILTYAKHLINEVFFIFKRYRLYIHYDGKEIKRKAVSLTIANAAKYGTGAVINPHGKLDDGRFELVIVKPFPRIKLFSLAWKMFMGTLQTSEYVEVIHCEKANIRSSRKTTLQIDGEVIGKVSEINAEINPGALNVLVPSAK
jgi:diacylglycerol kinase (ATP)